MAARTALIVGCGLAGSLLARLLAQAGWRVTVTERRGDPRESGYQGGRSINLALSARGRWGLAAAGLEERTLAQDAIAMRGRMMHSKNSELTFQPYSADLADAIFSVSRGGLNLSLLHAAAEDSKFGGGVEFIFNAACTDINLDERLAYFKSSSNARSWHQTADLIIGADGAFSPVRMAMQRTDRFEFSQSYLGHGYKELRIPHAHDPRLRTRAVRPAAWGDYSMDPNSLHIWPRGGSMMIALPNRDGSFTCTLFWPFAAEQHSFASLTSEKAIAAFFEAEYPDAAALMPDLTNDYIRNPVGSLITVKCGPWYYGDGCVVLGDAAHAIVPFYGQGMNAAFEDCRILAECLANHADQGEALRAFYELRKPNADAIAQMALDNFTEMRDLVGDPEFLYQKKIEQTLHRLYPDELVPQYNLVSFSTTPYATALRRGQELTLLYQRVIALVPRHLLKEIGQEEWVARVRIAAESRAPAGQPPAAQISVKTDAMPRLDELTVAYDISPLLNASTGVWKGDTPLHRRLLSELAKGDSVTLSTLESTVHLGSHADGPNHYVVGGADIAQMPLTHYVGRCQVVSCKVARGARATLADLDGGLESLVCSRILLRTGTFPDHQAWNDDFAALSPSLIEALADRGVITIGIDTPSVDLMSSKDLPAHAAFARRRVAIIEGLTLDAAPDGEYFLSALPLKLDGFDASPIRAVLMK